MKATVPDVIERQQLKKANLKSVNLGRYPFQASLKYYEPKLHSKLAPTTMTENLRKLVYFAKIFEKLKEKKLVDTTDPRNMSQYDIESFLDYMKENELAMSTMIKYTDILDSLLSLYENNVIHDMKKRGDWPLLKSAVGNSNALTLEELQAIFDAIDNYNPENEIEEWHWIVISGALPLLFGTACRPKEIFSAKLADLKLDKRDGESAFFVRHPKGEGSWGQKEWIPIIRGDMVERLEFFLVKRKQYLKEHDVTTTYLFPNLETGEPLTGNTFRKIKMEFEELSGVSFKLKDMRTTYATLTAGPDMTRLNNVSLQLRHQNTNTTSKFYVQADRQNAQKRMKDVWKETPIKNNKP